MNQKKAAKLKRIKEHNAAYIKEEIRKVNCCKDHVRTFEETYNGKFAPSKHAPSCDNYSTTAYKEVSLQDHDSFICSAEQFYEFEIKIGSKKDITVKDILLTVDQVEQLNTFPDYKYEKSLKRNTPGDIRILESMEPATTKSHYVR